MADISVHAASSTLSSLYAESIELLGRFARALGEENCRVIYLEQVQINDVLEAYGTVKIWGDQTKADLPASAHGSLDDTLRHDNEIKLLAKNVLRRLKAVLSEATSIAERKRDPAFGSDYDSISSVSDDSSSSSATESGDEEVERPQRRMPKIRLLVQQIREQIRSLYSLLSLLRRPKVTDRYIRSVSSKAKTDAAMPLDVGLIVFDERHIAEKMLQWRGLTKSGRGIMFGEEEVTVPSEGLTADSIDDVPWLCRRLAQANTRRREQLQYWQNHPYVFKRDQTNTARTAVRDLQLIGAEQEEKSQGPESQASTIKPTEIDLPRKGPESGTTRQSKRTAQTVYAPTAIGQGRSNSVPDPPVTEDGSTAFPCPYCGMLLKTSEMQDRQSWKRHVFRDLRPYVCTFQHCHNASKLYVSRHDWIYHELQVHRLRYVCQNCHEVYSFKSDIFFHLRTHYPESSFSASQLGVIADLCVRQMDISDTRQDPCLFCGESYSLSAMLGHLAAHLEDLALFVLPSTDEDEIGTLNASAQVAKLDSKGKGDDAASTASSLGFSEGKSWEQTPAEFAKLVASEEINHESKMSHWNIGEEDKKHFSPADPAFVPTRDVSDDAEVAFRTTVDDKERTIWVSKEGHKYTVPEMLEQGISLDSINMDGLTPLHLAASLGNSEEVRLLLHHGASIDKKTPVGEYAPPPFLIAGHTTGGGQSPLSLAASGGYESVVKLLIDKGSDVNAIYYSDRSALSWAASGGYESVVKLLIDKGSNVNARDYSGRSALSWAASGGHESVVKLLIDKGSNVSAKDRSGRSALSWAASGGHESVVKLLIDKGSNVSAKDRYGKSPLSWAASEGHESVVKLLIDKGSDVNARDYSDRSALSWAASGGHESVVKLLIDKGSDVNARDYSDRSALSWAASGGHESVVKLLIDKGSNVSAKDRYGKSPLLLAASGGHESVVKLLIDKGSNVSVKDRYGKSALSWAASGGHESVVKLLFDKGDVNANDYSWAASEGHESVVKLLIENGGDVNARDSFGRSLLTLAALGGHLGTVKLLLEIRNSKVDLFDKEILEVLWPLARGGNNAALLLLLERVHNGPPDSPSQNTPLYRVETDWCSVYDPGEPRVLDVDLAHKIPLHDLVSAKFSQDGKFFATACELTVHIYHVVTGEKLCQLQNSTYYDGSPKIRAICFSHDSQCLITAAGSFLNVWDITSRRILRTMRGHEGTVSSIDVARNHSSIVSGSTDTTARLWDVDTGRTTLTLNTGCQVTSVAISPDTKYVAAGLEGRGANVWDVQQGSLVLRAAEFSTASSLSWSSDGNRLAASAAGVGHKGVSICDTSVLGHASDLMTGGMRYFSVGERHEAISACFTPDDAWILSASSKGNLLFWDSRTQKAQLVVQHALLGLDLKSVEVSPAGGFFAAAGSRGAIIWSYRQVETVQGSDSA